jgi:hypothetical protein
MVKEIRIVLDDKDWERMNKTKEKHELTWRDMLDKACQSYELKK